MDLINKMIVGDSLNSLKKIPDGVVDCVVTSPPYWALRDYGTNPVKWADGWLGELGLRRYEEAIQSFDKSIEFHPEDAYSYYYRSQAYKALGKKDKANADYKKAVELNPSIVNNE